MFFLFYFLYIIHSSCPSTLSTIFECTYIAFISVHYNHGLINYNDSKAFSAFFNDLHENFPALIWNPSWRKGIHFQRVHGRGLQFYTFFGISIGITRRMIDIGKKITFYFLQNVWKCTVFSHLHFKFAKSAIMTQKIFFLKNINMGVKKTQNFMLISNLLMSALRNAPNKI